MDAIKIKKHLRTYEHNLQFYKIM